MPKTRALVIGGTGFIGAEVTGQLAAAGVEVTVYSRGKRSKPHPQVRWIEAPDTEQLLSFAPLRSLRFDVAVHLTAMGEDEGRVFADELGGSVGRAILVSSGDVYLAYGRFIGLEPGPPEPVPIAENGALRRHLHPYRGKAKSPADLAWRYDKILAEQPILDRSAGAVVRLPKVYGPGSDERLDTVYDFSGHPEWRWTHGYVEDVAAAIMLVALASKLPQRVYNLGEERTPTVGERLESLPKRDDTTPMTGSFDFRQSLAFDTSAIRRDLGFREPVPYMTGLRRTLRF
jgi:nucleoside-diphosphate-sugar epimerase